MSAPITPVMAVPFTRGVDYPYAMYPSFIPDINPTEETPVKEIMKGALMFVGEACVFAGKLFFDVGAVKPTSMYRKLGAILALLLIIFFGMLGTTGVGGSRLKNGKLVDAETGKKSTSVKTAVKKASKKGKKKFGADGLASQLIQKFGSIFGGGDDDEDDEEEEHHKPSRRHQIVYYHWNKCSHCTEFNPEWEQFKHVMADRQDLDIFDKEIEDHPDVVEKEKVYAFPSVKLDGEEIIFPEGERNAAYLIHYVDERI